SNIEKLTQYMVATASQTAAPQTPKVIESRANDEKTPLKRKRNRKKKKKAVKIRLSVGWQLDQLLPISKLRILTFL
ncbi:MAG: hypothetical protein VXW13_02280, partial [SAR324 cluster bacterium]|nr:hypothetical protein [SAR324 cluster bacterium]